MTLSNIQGDDIRIGKNVYVHPEAKIIGLNGPAKRIEIGDNSFIGAGVQIFCDDFILGDYCKIQNNTTIHGYKHCHIGHNAWIGQFTIIDCIGGMTIGNNCGIGAHSQLWSHVKYGDTLEGCQFNSSKEMIINDDVWFVGHCIVSPIHAESKSMALAGSVVTSDMKCNEIYAGTPAKSISSKVGMQFQEVSVEEKLRKMLIYLEGFTGEEKEKIRIVSGMQEVTAEDDDITYFDVSSRTYTKRGTNVEIEFMKYLLPEKAKFVPHDTI